MVMEWLLAAAENMLQAAYLTIGKLAPDYENVELSVGGSTVAAAVVEATGVTCHSLCQRNSCLLVVLQPTGLKHLLWSIDSTSEGRWQCR